ncbi:uncharacterized protein LOC129957446 [Argiope bruennichi]|uniref:uncharacterized protein LOC129957446 n=1 Tax=Argiope bruennichi TaxID=94029 RepID=UPI0024952702|nr:uncharacterized protein LOC129957446 [Argiope bruennichi]
MDSGLEQSMNALKQDLIALEANRRVYVHEKYIKDEIRLSECIDDILDLHTEVFLIPETKKKPDEMKNGHACSSNKTKHTASETGDLRNKSEDSSKKPFCIMEIPEHSAIESDDFEGESQNTDDNTRNDEYELGKKAFIDLIKDKEIEMSRLVKTLIDKFVHFSGKLEAVKDEK